MGPEEIPPTPEELYDRGVTIKDTLVREEQKKTAAQVVRDVVEHFGYSGISRDDVEKIALYTYRIIDTLGYVPL